MESGEGEGNPILSKYFGNSQFHKNPQKTEKEKKMDLKNVALWTLARMAYKLILRDLLAKAIANPDEEWDELVMEVCDKVFDYGTE